MKKIKLISFLLLSFVFVFTACKDKDDNIVELGSLVSATYDASTKYFTLKYSSGLDKDVKAVIDESSTPKTATATLDDGTTIYVSDASLSGTATISKDVNLVSQFVYDGMSSFYLWNTEVTNKKPTAADVFPAKYFYSILNSTDTQHGWSWITDDIESLLAGFSGEETGAFGFAPVFFWVDEAQTSIKAYVRYVFPNTPAANAGIKRGDIIAQVNGANLTLDNYRIIYGANSVTTFTVYDQNSENPRNVSITPGSFSTDPVLFSDVYEIEGKKIGYLFYTDFNASKNASLYNAFQNFKQAGVTDLVLDLRYNPGGSISAAIYLASMIAPETYVKNKSVFTTMTYNSYVNSAYDSNNWDRNAYLGSYQTSEQDPLNANLNLNNVYIIATSDSYSASELITFCLKPYMNVAHIGEKTGGKYTASWTVSAYDSFDGYAQPVYNASKLTTSQKSTLKNWGMQPIVGRYTDKNGTDFIRTNGLIPTYAITSQEYNTETWKQIGDEEDYLFAKAISLITGKAYAASATRNADLKQFSNAKLFSPKDEILKEGVVIDRPQIILPE